MKSSEDTMLSWSLVPFVDSTKETMRLQCRGFYTDFSDHCGFRKINAKH